MMQSFISMGVVTIIWVLVGFSLAYGGDHGRVIGDFKLRRPPGRRARARAALRARRSPSSAFFLFQVMFAIITPALITGAFADRVSFKSYLSSSCSGACWSTSRSSTGSGAAASSPKWGVVDFAGGIVVHLSAGMAALASVFVVGKRKSRRARTSRRTTSPSSRWAPACSGSAGSASTAGAPGRQGVAAVAFVNTNTAAAVAMVTWLVIAWWREGKPSMTGALTGAVAGLATVTPAAGMCRRGRPRHRACWPGRLLRRGPIPLRRDWDDALDVWGVHGVGGRLGTILVGVFASAAINGTSGLIEGNVRQLGVQLAGVVLAVVYAFGVSYGLLRVINVFLPVRVSEEVEFEGLDSTVLGETAYAV